MAAISKAAAGLTFSKIISQTNVTRKFLSPFMVRVKVPGGFPYESFNGEAFLRPGSLIKMVESTRAAAFNKTSEDDQSFLDFAAIYQDFLIFNASTSMNIRHELYDLTVLKGPLEIDVKLDYVGTASFKLKTTIFIEGFSNPVCENLTQSVFVSNKTRMPAAPPDWWKEKYSLGSENGEPLKLARLNVPQDVRFSEYQMEVPASDVDSYMHVNWSNPIKYCHNAYVHSELKKHGEQGAQQAFRNMKYFNTSYIKEVFIGDTLNVRFWKGDVKSDLFNFQLLKASDVIGECNVEFF